MNRSRLQCFATIVTLAWAAVTAAQTTRSAPPPATWSATIEQIARATEDGDVPLVIASLTPDAQVRSFEAPDRAAGARALVDGAADWKLLGSHAHEFPPATLATDIASDVKRSDIVAEADKRKITPLDDAEAARANTVAADWIAQTLSAERNHLIGVAVYWHTKANRPVFILMKGQQSGETYAVKLAVYGDPMARRAQAAPPTK